MSVWHETQVEHVIDAIDNIVDEHGNTDELIRIRNIVSEAWVHVTDLPKNSAESMKLIEKSIKLFEKAEVLVDKAKETVPVNQERDWRILRNRVRSAKVAVVEAD